MPDDAPKPLRITNALADLGLLYPWLDDAVKRYVLPPNLLERMHIALEEAAMNVAMHGYPPGTTGAIIVRLQVEPNAAILQVEDFGPPFDPVSVPATTKPVSVTDTTPGGLGLALLHHFCSDLSYARIAGSNRLTLRFRFETA